jgi:hypothetical protein
MNEMSPIEVDAHPLDVAHDRTATCHPISDDLPENDFHPGEWIGAILLGLTLWGLIFWLVL